MHDVFLGIGSNVGDRVRYLADAVRELKTLPSSGIVSFSSVYETEPVGIKEQRSFLNAAVWMQTSFDVHEFHSRLKSIERDVGRQERIRWGPREIDIDILLFGDLMIDEPTLRIPHREMVNRKFVLQPLAEIAPEIIHPASQKRIRELLDECDDSSAVDRSELMTEAFSQICEE